MPQDDIAGARGEEPVSSTLKTADVSLWLRNIQLGLFAIPLACGAMLLRDGRKVHMRGALHGFDVIVWAIVLLNAIGGLLVAATMKYADNIIKCFATALAILTATLLSVPLLGFSPSGSFAIGMVVTMAAASLYSSAPDLAACTRFAATWRS